MLVPVERTLCRARGDWIPISLGREGDRGTYICVQNGKRIVCEFRLSSGRLNSGYCG